MKKVIVFTTIGLLTYFFFEVGMSLYAENYCTKKVEQQLVGKPTRREPTSEEKANGLIWVSTAYPLREECFSKFPPRPLMRMLNKTFP